MPGNSWKSYTPLMRLEDRIAFDDDGCWRWTGHVQTTGYGQMQIDRRHVVVHRVAWMLFRGPIPDGMDVHHRCGTKRCCNPEHLELVPHALHKARHHRRRHCQRGHPLTAETTSRGRCRLCARASRQRYAERQGLGGHDG
jgi:hypothetical protein